MIVAVLNGWGSSSRLRETRTAALVRRVTKGKVSIRGFLARRAMIGWARSRRFKRFILRREDPEETLLLVGKSLGARNMITRVLNQLPMLQYRKVALLTIDPCWPERWDWKPNLNRRVLELTHPVHRAVNVYAVLPPDKQAGSMVGLNLSNNMLTDLIVQNVPLMHVDHHTIVQSEEVEEELCALVDYLSQ